MSKPRPDFMRDADRATLKDALAAFDLYAQHCRLNEEEDIRDGDAVRWVTAARAETWERAAAILRATNGEGVGLDVSVPVEVDEWYDRDAKEMLRESTENLIIAFRRWTIDRYGVSPTDDDFRGILATAAALPFGEGRDE